MADFATIDAAEGVLHPVLVWSAAPDGCRVKSRHKNLHEAGGFAEVYRFRVPTTLATKHPANEGEHPSVDVDGAPLWPGARVGFVIATHHSQTAEGKGAFDRVDRYGSVHFVADEAIPRYGSAGLVLEMVRDHASQSTELHHYGPLEGYRVLARKSGDPVTGSQVVALMRLIGDPRDVSALLSLQDLADDVGAAALVPSFAVDDVDRVGDKVDSDLVNGMS